MALFPPFKVSLTMLIGYVRVSTNDQNTALQRNA
ncbi:DNA-invertase, partial [Escherichia coli]|nr:DNA-invertase [Escherichia coli]